MLIENGKILKNKLAKEVLSLQELEAAAHKQGFGDLREVDRATLDPSGTISFTGKKPAPEEERHRELLGRLDQLASDIATLRLESCPRRRKRGSRSGQCISIPVAAIPRPASPETIPRSQ